MPIALPAMTGTLTANLLATALVGKDTPKLANGVATGLMYWVPTIRATSIDTGSVGVGVGTPIPLVVPQPVLLGFLLANIPPAGFTGLFAPSLILGLANGLALTFLQMLVSTIHPGIGSGAGVVTFRAPPAAIPMVAGFASAGLVGESSPKLAAAIGRALDASFATLVLPIAIVGSASPVPGVGAGTGSLV